jgi:predicted small integral membrane protein
MTYGDKIFYSIMALIYIGLFWLKFVEKHLNIWFCLIPWFLATILIAKPSILKRR